MTARPPCWGRAFSSLKGHPISTTEARTAEFHQAFGHPVRTEPQTIDRKEALLALKLIEEEFLELAVALFPSLHPELEYINTIVEIIEAGDYEGSFEYEPDLLQIADALGDLDVVINGAGIRHGLDMQAISREVFRSNMSKLDADGKPVYTVPGDPTSKIGKSELFREPDLAAVLGISA